MKILVLKTGTTFDALSDRRGDFEAWFAKALGWPVDHLTVLDVFHGDDLPDPIEADGIIVTGSSAHVYEYEPWSVRAGAWLRKAVEADIPTLAVCYGHQLLADALGASVKLNPKGREMGLVQVDVEDDPLFDGLPKRIQVLESHVDAVMTVPDGARILAQNENTAVQSFAYRNARAVQWHPEFDADIVQFYIDARREGIDAIGGPGTADAIEKGLGEASSGPIIMANFIRHFVQK